MNILFIGGLFPKETEIEILNNSKGNIDNAANNLQWELVKGLEENLKGGLTLFNSLFIGSYPMRFRQWKIRQYDFSENLTYSRGRNIGFLNITGIKQVDRYVKLKPLVSQWIKSNNGANSIIIAYSMTPTFTRILEYSKKIDPWITTCLIVPDLPEYMNLSEKKNKAQIYFENYEHNSVKRSMEYIDCYVLLTELMAQALNIDKPHVVVEGISNSSVSLNRLVVRNSSANDKTIVYTGSLYKRFGVVELIDAFNQTHADDYKLILCGAGDAEDYIVHECKKNPNIVYKGMVSRQEVMDIQKQATFLVNPRNNNDEYTKYSFPSKIMEYMSSGRPVLAFKLDGMPDIYKDYLYMIDGEKESLYKKLLEVMNKSEEELKEKGREAQRFVITEKNNIKQTKKIIDMLDTVTSVKHLRGKEHV